MNPGGPAERRAFFFYKKIRTLQSGIVPGRDRIPAQPLNRLPALGIFKRLFIGGKEAPFDRHWKGKGVPFGAIFTLRRERRTLRSESYAAAGWLIPFFSPSMMWKIAAGRSEGRKEKPLSSPPLRLQEENRQGFHHENRCAPYPTKAGRSRLIALLHLTLIYYAQALKNIESKANFF